VRSPTSTAVPGPPSSYSYASEAEPSLLVDRVRYGEVSKAGHLLFWTNTGSLEHHSLTSSTSSDYQ
jgi:hypothetical protein